MLDFVIFAITFTVFLIALVFYLYPGSRKLTTIPGLDPSDAKEGNISDILQAGSLPQFLETLHKRYGEISSFWMGTNLIASIASTELFEQQKHVFDKPADLFALYHPFVGDGSILYANGAEGRKKRKIWDKYFSLQNSKRCISFLKEFVSELSEQWSVLPPDQHIPLYQYMAAFSMKICTKMAFGEHFDDPKAVVEFKRNFEICWLELESRVSGSVPEPNSTREDILKDTVGKMRKALAKVLTELKSKEECFISHLSEQGLSKDEILDEAMTFVIKFYSIASALTWAVYFVASHKDEQEKLAKKLVEVKREYSSEDDEHFDFLHCIVDECLRLAAVEPWTARCQDIDVEIGGHIIPKQTPIIQALEVVLHSDMHWTLSNKFDPSRFNGVDVASKKVAFHPFGFAGQRICPAKDWVRIQISLLLKELFTRFNLTLVEGQIILPSYRICSRPEDEVWITVKLRKN